MFKSWRDLAMLLPLGIAFAASVVRADNVNLDGPATLFSPPSAWQTENTVCGIANSTITNNSNMTFTFVGNYFIVNGLQDNSTGLVEVHVDGALAARYALQSAVTTCGIMFTYISTNTASVEHSVTLILLDSGSPTHLDITDVAFGVAIPPSSSALPETPTPSFIASSATAFATATVVSQEVPFATSSAGPVFAYNPPSTNVGLIVGAVVGSVAGAAILGGLLFWLYRKRRVASYSRRTGLGYGLDPTPHVSNVAIAPAVVMIPAEPEKSKSEVDLKIADLEARPPSYMSHPETQ